MKYTLIILFAFWLAACQQTYKTSQQDEPITLIVHQDSLIGWTLEIPSNWKIKTPEEIAQLNQKGIESMENVVGTEADANLFSNCLSFAKDSVNLFQAVREIHG